MKVKVNRLLSAGRYHVNFEVADFTPDELNKMSSFGVPTIDLRWAGPQGQTDGRIQLNQIKASLDAIFSTDQEARDYESKVKAQIRTAMELLRQRKDDFSSSEEEEL